jgi:glycosyltransferase involved in cell wall biosynthesis
MIVSLVISVYNEEEALPFFLNELTNDLLLINEEIQIIFINDGSTDRSIDILTRFVNIDSRAKILHFSRNFGHEAAMLAGLHHSTGDVIICMDSDLQHPTKKILSMIESYKSGNDVVLMVRDERKDYHFLKQWFTSFFYYFLNTFSEYKFESNASDFFLISTRVSNIVLNEFKEYNKFLRGIIQNIGFKIGKIHYIAPKRVAGKSKYSIYKLVLFSFAAISTTSLMPLRLGLFVGVLFALFSIIVTIYSIFMKFFSQPTSGYTSLIVFLSISFSLLFFIIGIIGEYIANIFKETKGRPSYIIEKIIKKNDSVLLK